MSGYGKNDAAKDTGSSSSQVSKAWHEARERAQKDGELPERATHKAQKSSSSSSSSGSDDSSK